MPDPRPVTLLAPHARICLFALCLLHAPVTAAASDPVTPTGRASSLAVVSPARGLGSVPLTGGRRSKPRPASLGRRAPGLAAGELGTPYRYGGSAPSGFDCSGLVAYVYGKLGVRLPHNAAAQYAYGRAVDRRHLEA